MPNFNETFKKVFIGTKPTTANTNQVQGFITTAALGTEVLQVNTGVAGTTYGVGSYGFFNAATWKSVTAGSIGATAPVLVLAAASLQLTDMLGNNQGGYKESNKSKDINPRYIVSFQKFVPCASSQHILHIGSTKYTKTLSPSQSACNFEFVCGEDYYLRIEIRNDPMYRFLDRNAYRLFQYNGGCCADDAPGAVIDGTLAMIAWASAIIIDPEIKDFVTPIVYSEAGVALYPPGTGGGVYEWDDYVSPGHVDGQYAGMRLQGAYVETEFGNCSFQTTDYYNKIPIEILSSMVDFNGDPCAFTGICVNTECYPYQGNGFGETILRDTILSELYRQNPFPTDQRIREILMGSDILDAISRSTQYYRYSITHQVPRPNNPNRTFSAEQYTLDIISTAANATFETFMSTWLSNANSLVTMETDSCIYSCSALTP